MKSIYDTLESPLITEKGSFLSTNRNQYVFRVNTASNKDEIKVAVEKIFNVTVERVNTMNVVGKMKRVRHRPGRTAAWKKAIVTLKQGQKIDLTK